MATGHGGPGIDRCSALVTSHELPSTGALRCTPISAWFRAWKAAL